MAANSFGKLFQITTFGESHGPAIGVVIDGCPAGLKITAQEINKELLKRKTTQKNFSSKRKEPDQVQILSGLFKGQTTGAPIALLIPNQDLTSSYDKIKDLYRPGHANYTYLNKYGLFDFAGAGRASARETVARVAAGAIAKKLLKKFKIEFCAFLFQIGDLKLSSVNSSFNLNSPSFFKLTSNLKNFNHFQKKIIKNPLFCPDSKTEKEFLQKLKKIKQEKETIGGVVQLISTPLPIGLGDPIFEKLSANLAKAMFSIPSVKGFEMGEGFHSATLKGSEMNDLFTLEKAATKETVKTKSKEKNKKQLVFKTNHAGGTLGGISNGSGLDLKVAFKPISTIGKTQSTYNLKNEKKELIFENIEKHDLCAAIRAVPIVEAMTALVLADALLISKAYSPL